MKFKFILFIIIVSVLVVLGIKYYRNSLLGLEPIAVYNEYRIYDLVEQKGLACPDAIEILASDEEYDYYFTCLKSDKIYLVSDKKKYKVRDAYEKGVITKEKLYDLGIIKRMVRISE